MVGDRVSIDTDSGRRYGTITQITDNSRLHNIFSGQSTDDQFRSFTYIITTEDTGEEATRYKASELQRDRRVYSKLVLKQFLRSAVSREAWNGAPWMVKDHLAKRYDIPTKVPEAKTRDAIMAAKKAANAAHANSATSPANSPNMVHGPDPRGPYMNGARPPMAGPGQTTFVNFAANAPPHYLQDSVRGMMPPPMNGTSLPPFPYSGHPPLPLIHGRPPMPPLHPPPQIPTNLPPHLAQIAQHMPPPGSGLPISLPFQNNFMQYQTLAPTNPPQLPAVPLAKPFEPIKYPIEDLRIKQPRISVQRPALKFFSDDVPDGAEAPPDEKKTGILMKSMGPLLCTWETLNVHDTIYMLDSFTLDDFVEAMRFSSAEVECELLTEVHCAVLKQYVNDSGKLQVPLPHISDEDESGDEESSKETTPEPEPEPPVRTTRSSLRKSEANMIMKQRTPTPEPPKQLHKAAEFLADFDWVEQCGIRNFREGGWEAILVGLLHRLSFNPTHKDTCDEILAKLVPPDEVPLVEKIAYNYVYLDVNLRIAALDIALRLTVTTEHFRDQLVAASQEMTRLRKEKIDFQKKRKELYVHHIASTKVNILTRNRADELFKLDIERKIHLPLNTPASPVESKENQDVSMTGMDEVKDSEAESESAEEPPAGNRKLRKTVKQNKRKRESEVAKKEKAKKAKAEAAKTKQQKEWEKLLDAIEKKKEELRTCEANINELDDDLRETLVHRSKVLGKDRFLNKYYWFEHNGMPFGGVPTSSTAEYGYANGRVWVQGPDEYELQPNLEEPAVSQDMAEFGWTVPMRKEKEEGSTHLSTSAEWGYYDDPSDIDKLMGWLDERGLREKALRKELQIFRDRIAEYMVKMKEHLDETEKSKAEEEDNAPRISTRKKTYAEKDVTKSRCLLWTNSIMRDEVGHNHSEEYEPPKKQRKGVAKVTKGKGRK